MHVRMTVTYFKGKLTPKEAHVDCHSSIDTAQSIIADCFEVLCSKQKELDAMLPQQLKAREFDIIVHGEYLKGFDFVDGRWLYDKTIFNVLQLGIPENEKPLIKT